MFEPINDLSNQAQAPVRFNTRTRGRKTSVLSPDGTTKLHGPYHRIHVDPRYRHFARIPDRIVRCLDYFEVGCDRLAATRVLAAYYLFIAVVDDALDAGEAHAATTVFAHLSAAPPRAGWHLSEVGRITEELKRQLNYKLDAALRDQFALLYQAVRRERAAASIEAYVEARKAVGGLTADLSYQLIGPLLDADNQNLRTFMKRVGAVGCLVDSVIDLGADQREGLLSFQPTVRDHIKLALITCREGLSIALAHPRLAGLFIMSVLDNIHDRFPASKPSVFAVQGKI